MQKKDTTTNPEWRESRAQALSPWLVALTSEIKDGTRGRFSSAKLPDSDLSVILGESSLWGHLRWGQAEKKGPTGGLALRLSYSPGTVEMVERPCGSAFGTYLMRTPVGAIQVELTQPDPALPMIRWRTSLTPTQKLVIPFWPRDVIPINGSQDLLTTYGLLYATQRGPKAGILYGSVAHPPAGAFLYLQNFTSLNDYCEATRTNPNGAVAGEWPEMGFALPTTTENPLTPGKTVILSDAFVHVSPRTPKDHQEAGALFLELFAAMYRHLPRPETTYRDWLTRAQETVRDLEHKDCITRRRGLKYFNAYVGTGDRPPESMVQLSVLVPILDYMRNRHVEVPLAKEIQANLGSFFNPSIGALVRYLPGDAFPEGAEQHQNHEVMDSWYVYHTLLNAGRLAAVGDDEAKRLLIQSLPYAMKVARHFKYKWPIFYNMNTLEVEKSEGSSGYGETDVAGLYALMLLQAYDLTGNKEYYKEAETAALTLKDYGFQLGYQFNSTIYGAMALARLWKDTGRKLYLDISIVCMANVFANSWLWECNFGHGQYYPTFMGLPPLDNAPYIAIYEESEVLAALASYMETCGDALPPSLETLMPEFAKYVLHRAWQAYPSELPKKILAKKSHDGHLDTKLAIPLEDLGDGWYVPGTVGQEVYGAGAAPLFAAWAYHDGPEEAFLIYCDYVTGKFRQSGNARKGKVQFWVRGNPQMTATIRLIPAKVKTLPRLSVRQGKGKKTEQPQRRIGKDIEVTVRGGAEVTIEWGGGRGR